MNTTTKIRKQVQAGIDARTGTARKAGASPWMTEEEAAGYTGFSRAALSSMRYEHRGPAYSKPAGRIRYHRDDLDTFMREGRKSA